MLGSEKREAYEAYGGGDAVGVGLELFPRLKALGLEVHAASLDEVEKVVAGDLVLVTQLEDGGLQGGGLGDLAFKESLPMIEAL